MKEGGRGQRGREGQKKKGRKERKGRAHDALFLFSQKKKTIERTCSLLTPPSPSDTSATHTGLLTINISKTSLLPSIHWYPRSTAGFLLFCSHQLVISLKRLLRPRQMRPCSDYLRSYRTNECRGSEYQPSCIFCEGFTTRLVVCYRLQSVCLHFSHKRPYCSQ